IIRSDVPSHSPRMDGVAAQLQEALHDVRSHPVHTVFCSTVDGRPVEGTALGAAYWARNVRQPVRFADAVQWALQDEVSVFIELGAHPLVSYDLRQSADAAGREVAVIACA